MKKKAIINTELVDMLQLIPDERLESELGESFSAVLVNPSVVWAKFILTDDNSNENSQRIPTKEFDNLIKTGQFMPVKMAEGRIEDGHDNAKPLGVITHLRREQLAATNGQILNQIIAIAAFWAKERPADIEYLREMVKAGEKLNISWEIMYSDYEIDPDSGVVDLLGTSLRAATIVGKPAYSGRTPILAISAKKWSKPYIEGLPDDCFLVVEKRNYPDGSSRSFRHFAYKDGDGNVDPSRFAAILTEISGSGLPANILKRVKAEVKKLLDKAEAGASIQLLNDLKIEPVIFTKTEEDKLDELEKLTKEIEELRKQLAEKDALVADLEAQLSDLRGTLEAQKEQAESASAELAELREFKKATEAAIEKEQRLEAVKAKFSAAGLEKPDAYFSENRDMLLGLDDSAIDFLIQELLAFSANSESTSSSATIPPISNIGAGKPDVQELARALRERGRK